MEPVVGTEIELDEQVNVLVAVALTWPSRVLERDLKVVVVTGLILLQDVAVGFLGRGARALVDPVGLGVTLIAGLIREGTHAGDPYRVPALTEVGDAHGVDETGERGLENVLNHVGHGDKQAGINVLHVSVMFPSGKATYTPDELDEAVEPLSALGVRRGKGLTASTREVEADGVDLLLEVLEQKAGSGVQTDANEQEEEGAPQGRPESVTKGDEEPEHEHRSNDQVLELIATVQQIADRRRGRRREGVVGDVPA